MLKQAQLGQAESSFLVIFLAITVYIHLIGADVNSLSIMSGCIKWRKTIVLCCSAMPVGLRKNANPIYIEL